MVRRLAAIKFGAQTADNLVTILGANPTAERMDRVGVAIMECDSGAELWRGARRREHRHL